MKILLRGQVLFWHYRISSTDLKGKIIFYYMASSVSGQDESNPAQLFAPRADLASSGLPAVSRRKTFPESHIITPLTVSITKFSIVIGSRRAYLSFNRRKITWVSNYGCPIWTFCTWIPIIGYPRGFYVNYGRLNDFLRNVSHSFQN